MPYGRTQLKIGGYYHIYNGGHNYQPVFLNKRIIYIFYVNCGNTYYIELLQSLLIV